MNIEELIYGIKGRPGMFVKDKRLDYIKYFIAGFYCHGSVSKTAAAIDEHFSGQFHSWVREWITNNLGITFQGESGWYEYITFSTQNNEKAFDLFCKLTDEFFAEFHRS
ncbi:hypothetical protein QWJ34_26290 [Saccharibacillus sp. CPCC 101409]|uniref:hypothetical protein n=1 Tax=Saccharibacillus sp. CPCC 101409 TaxID=3058041 RepID=UPI002670D411|nr:hypothetical protein [Saccharibacillus sp. CPCC 101409]MDO3413289.1 hypothetical protein [Saccharibacillus sp. CPCC 101409]